MASSFTSRQRAAVDRGHALICTGATARPGRDRNTGRRAASIQEQILAVEVGLNFQQSFSFMFLDVHQMVFMISVPDIPVVCRDGYAQRKTVSRPHRRRGLRSVHSRCFSCTAELVARGTLDTTFMSPLYLTVICSPSGRFWRRVFESPR